MTYELYRHEIPKWIRTGPTPLQSQDLGKRQTSITAHENLYP